MRASRMQIEGASFLDYFSVATETDQVAFMVQFTAHNASELLRFQRSHTSFRLVTALAKVLLISAALESAATILRFSLFVKRKIGDLM